MCVWSERELRTTDGEDQVLEFIEVCTGDLEQASGVVKGSTGGALVGVEGIYLLS